MTNRPAATQNLVALFDQSDRRDLEFGVQSNSLPRRPTTEVSAEWQFFFSYFNERLFDNTLPDCIITFTQHPLAQGYFCAAAFRDRNGTVAHEIAMNPSYFHLGDTESFQTLVHEMAHLWRHLHGKRNRKGGHGAPGYHDAVWADRMEAIGLMPSDTGKPDGKRTGYHMREYVIEGGPFDLACRELLISGHGVNWRDSRQPFGIGDPFADMGEPEAAGLGPVPPPRRRKTRARFECPICSVKAWSRPSARLACSACDKPLVAR